MTRRHCSTCQQTVEKVYCSRCDEFQEVNHADNCPGDQERKDHQAECQGDRGFR